MIKTQYKDSQYTLKPNMVEVLVNGAKNMRDKLIIECLYYPALRRFEVCELLVENVNVKNGRITLRGKGGKIADIPVGSLYPSFISNLKFFIGNKGKKEFVFTSNRRRKLEVSRVNQILSEISKRLNIPNPIPSKKYVNPHLLRHSQARRLKDEGYNAEFIKNYMRHSSIKTTYDTYGTLGIDEMEKIATFKKQEQTMMLK